VNQELAHTIRSYQKYGKMDAFAAPNPLKRGPRFDMPMPGMKSIVAADILLTWILCNVSM
jgi:hypothetical protein